MVYLPVADRFFCIVVVWHNVWHNQTSLDSAAAPTALSVVALAVLFSTSLSYVTFSQRNLDKSVCQECYVVFAYCAANKLA